jgi:integrase/recombinase XerD
MGRKGALTIDGLQQIMKRLGRRAGVWPVGLHRFRRTFAIAAYRNGMNLLELKEIMGHADLSTTRGYLKFEKEDLLRAHERASPVDNWKL